MDDRGGRKAWLDGGRPAGGPASVGADAGARAAAAAHGGDDAAGAPAAPGQPRRAPAAAETGGGSSGHVPSAGTPPAQQPLQAPLASPAPRPRRATAAVAAARIRTGSAPQPAGSWDTAGAACRGSSGGGNDDSCSSSDSGSENPSLCETEELLEGAAADDTGTPQQQTAVHGQTVDCTSAGVGAFWQVYSTLSLDSALLKRGSPLARPLLAVVRVPKGLPAAWFPNAALPLDISLQLEVDGAAWGPRFASTITKGSFVSKGARRFSELAGCRVTGWRRAAGPAALDMIVTSVGVDAEQAAALPRRAMGRAAEAGDEEEGAWPVAISVTANSIKNRAVSLPTAMVAAWWPGAAFPLPVDVTVRVDGTMRHVVQATVKKYTVARRGVVSGYQLAASLPLPPGSTILRFKRLGLASIELHAREPPPAGRRRWAGAGTAAAGADNGGEESAEVMTSSLGEGSSSGEGEAPPPQPPPRQRQRQRVRRTGPPQPPPPAEQLVTEEEAAGGLEEDGSAPEPSAQHPPTAPPATASAATAAATVTASHAPATQPQGGAAAAALAALALPPIPLPPADDSVGLVHAAVALFGAVSSAAGALALAPVLRDAVLDVIEGESVQPEKCTALVGMAYPRLRRAAAAGDAAAALAWMERVAARGGGGGGGGS